MSDTMRKSFMFCTGVLITVGMILSIAAILTPSWQVVNLQEYNSVHEHGLWLDCTRHVRDGHALLRRYTTITEPLHCVYKFDYDKYSGTFDIEDDNSPVGEVNRHKFYGWHTATMVLLTLALLTSILLLCLAACGCCYAALTIVFTIATLFTVLLSTVALGIFFFFSHRADNRFIKGIVATYEQRVGMAFFLQMAACGVQFVAFITATVSTYFAMSVKGGALDRYSIQNSSKTNMTNVGRSHSQKQLAALAQARAIEDANGGRLFLDYGEASAPLLAIQAAFSPQTQPYLYDGLPASRASSSVTVFDTTPRPASAASGTGAPLYYNREPYGARRGVTSAASGGTLVETEFVERQQYHRSDTLTPTATR